MHNTAVYLVSGKFVPSQRWREAFANGRTLSWPVEASAGPGMNAGDGQPVYWTGTHDGWKDVIRWARFEGHNAPVVVVSATPDDAQALEALDAGARGYCHAHAVAALQQDVQKTVASGELWVGAELLTRMMKITRHWLASNNARTMQLELSAREVEVTQAVLQGLSNKEVARKLNISERTVKAHLGAIFEKLGVRDRLQMVLALRSTTINLSEGG